MFKERSPSARWGVDPHLLDTQRWGVVVSVQASGCRVRCDHAMTVVDATQKFLSHFFESSWGAEYLTSGYRFLVQIVTTCVQPVHGDQVCLSNSVRKCSTGLPVEHFRILQKVRGPPVLQGFNGSQRALSDYAVGGCGHRHSGGDDGNGGGVQNGVGTAHFELFGRRFQGVGSTCGVWCSGCVSQAEGVFVSRIGGVYPTLRGGGGLIFIRGQSGYSFLPCS